MLSPLTWGTEELSLQANTPLRVSGLSSATQTLPTELKHTHLSRSYQLQLQALVPTGPGRAFHPPWEGQRGAPGATPLHLPLLGTVSSLPTVVARVHNPIGLAGAGVAGGLA